MKKIATSLFPVLLCVLCFCACIKREQKEKTESLRIVSLSPALTELIFQLGAEKSLQGRTDVCDFPDSPDLKAVPVVGTFGGPEVEKVILRKPTHIFANTLIQPQLKKKLSESGSKVVLQPCDTLKDYLRWVDLLGMELNKRAAAEKERTRIETWLKENTARKGSGKKLLFVLWDQPLTVAGAGTLPDSAIRLAGGINAAASEKGYFKCSSEFLLTAEIDGIVWALDKPYSLKRDLPLWRVPDPDLLLRPGPRFPDGVDALRTWLEKTEAPE